MDQWMAELSESLRIVERPTWEIVVGYLFAVLVGHLCLRRLMQAAWDRIPLEDKPRTDEEHFSTEWQPQLVGILERLLYVSALLVHQGAFIAWWLALKVAGQWGTWKHHRSVFHNLLIESGASILFAVVGWRLVFWLAAEEWIVAIGVPALLVLGSLLAAIWIRDYAVKARSAEPSESAG